MKRLFAIAGLAAALAIASYGAIASADVPTLVDDPIAMTQTADFVTDIIAADAVDKTFLVLAYDNSFVPECRNNLPNFKAFCAEVAAGPLVPGDNSGLDECNPYSSSYRGEEFCNPD